MSSSSLIVFTLQPCVIRLNGSCTKVTLCDGKQPGYKGIELIVSRHTFGCNCYFRLCILTWPWWWVTRISTFACVLDGYTIYCMDHANANYLILARQCCVHEQFFRESMQYPGTSPLLFQSYLHYAWTQRQTRLLTPPPSKCNLRCLHWVSHAVYNMY